MKQILFYFKITLYTKNLDDDQGSHRYREQSSDKDKMLARHLPSKVTD